MRHFLLPALLLPTAAMAHTDPGAHGSAFVSGLAHPLLGPDHLLAMVAVGIFAALSGGTVRRALPTAFVAAMLLGGWLGYAGAALPVIEPTILASVILLGAAIAFALRPPLALSCAAIATFGMAHGFAHGLEGPAIGGLPYAAGFVISTVALIGAGLGLGTLANRLGRPSLARIAGALTATAGLALALG